MRNLDQIAGKHRLKGGGQAGTLDPKSPLTTRAKPRMVTPAHGSFAHSAPIGAVDVPADGPVTSCSAASAVCRSAGFWQVNRRAST